MKKYEELLNLTSDDRANIVKEKADAANTLEESGKKLVGKTMAVMEVSGDVGESTLDVYMKERGIDVKALKGVYEIARIFRAVIDKKIDMTEEQFDKAERSKLEILSRFFKEGNEHLLPQAVDMVKEGKTAKALRELLPKKPKKNTDPKDDPNPNVRVALIIDDIAPDGSIFESQKLRNRMGEDIKKAGQNPDAQEINGIVDRAARILALSAQVAGADPYEILGDIMAQLAKVTPATPVTPAPTLKSAAA